MNKKSDERKNYIAIILNDFITLILLQKYCVPCETPVLNDFHHNIFCKRKVFQKTAKAL